MVYKVELQGKLFVLVEKDDEGTHICAEIGGVDIWDWLNQHHNYNVKVTLEKCEDIKTINNN